MSMGALFSELHCKSPTYLYYKGQRIAAPVPIRVNEHAEYSVTYVPILQIIDSLWPLALQWYRA